MENKRFISALAACAMILTAASCGGKEEISGTRIDEGQDIPENYSVAEEDMPYGSKVTELRPETDSNLHNMICFDNRYFSDYNEIYKIDEYINGINENNPEYVKNAFYPEYLEYAASKSGIDSADDYISNYYLTLKEMLGEGFSINYIDISKCFEPGAEIAQSYFDDADAAITEIDGAEVLEKVTSKKVVEIGGYTTYELSDGVYQFTNHAEPLIIR
ncbi:MAG: hypothetical protein K2J26_02140, partial [Ruminococcus sp.]|nr:hypothetical protein [Ruminococcus sp.]